MIIVFEPQFEMLPFPSYILFDLLKYLFSLIKIPILYFSTIKLYTVNLSPIPFIL